MHDYFFKCQYDRVKNQIGKEMDSKNKYYYNQKEKFTLHFYVSHYSVFLYTKVSGTINYVCKKN